MEQLIEPIGHIGLCNADRAKDVILKLGCDSFGDSLCSTPTLRKLAESYGKKIIVCSYKPFIFENNPYVKFHIHSKDFKEEFREQYEVLETFQLGGSQSLKLNGMSVKYGSVDIRRIHCTNLGFDLRPNEMHCEYHPGPINFKESDERFLNSGGYIVIHVSKTWPSRTWAKSNYENLITNINKAGYRVALIGYDTPTEATNSYSKVCYDFSEFEFEGVSFLNRTSLDQDFEIIKKANICITCDTGILHLAGCTDTEIIYIGGSIDPTLRAPYRHGGQDYKFSFVGGECKIFCGSDIKYCVTEHANLNSLPQISVCLEQKPTFECHPTHEQVFKKIAEVNLRNLKEAEKVVLVDLSSSALGDSLAWIPYVEEYRLKNNCKIYCSTFKNELFEKGYPEINFIEPGSVVDCNEVIVIGWTKDDGTGKFRPPLGIRQRSLQETASFCLGLEDHKERKPKICIENKEKKIEGKYVCIATQSTIQAKYWNNKEGWDKTVEYLQELGYKVVCIDKHRSFGIEGRWNLIPEGAIDKTGDLPLQERITDLHNCEFFIGLPSGLSWLAWALDKEVVMISGFSDPKTEFYTPYRIINTEVCNSCFNKEEFVVEGWNWCPYHEGTERECECTKEITFEDVKGEIDKVINFVDLEKKRQITLDGLTQNVLKLGDKTKTLEGIREQWQEIFMRQAYESLSPIEKDDVVLDIGANVGFFSAFAMWREASKCYSIEPVPYNFKILTNWMGTSKNRDKFFLINKAIADKPLGQESLMNGDEEDCSKIEIIKLSDFFKKHPSENFDFIKIDCEGGEWSVLNNEKELDLLIEKTKKLAMELHLRLGWKENAQTFDFNFDFVDRFINKGFDIKLTTVDGVEITSQILNNERLAGQNDLLAHDYYRQIMFFAKKKTTILKKILVDLTSSALGDSLAWVPYVEEYRLENNRKVYCSTFKNELFKESYPEINFIEPGGEVVDCDGVIEIGFSKVPLHIRQRSLQEIASFCLGLEDHQERKPKVDIEDKGRKIEGKYVCIATQSTAQAKYWNNKEGWNKVVKYLKLLDYKVVCIDRYNEFGIEGQRNYIPKGVIDKTGDFSLQERITDIYNCEFFIGLSSGLSWLAWALDKEVVLISGFTKPSNEFFTPYRSINKDVCHGCYHEEKFDRDNWNWCPYHEGTERQFECTKEITFEDVRKEIDKIIS